MTTIFKTLGKAAAFALIALFAVFLMLFGTYNLVLATIYP